MKRIGCKRAAVFVALILMVTSLCRAQEVSVKFLRAAVASLDNREEVRVTGIYSGSNGLQEPSDTYLREKGYSRFTIRALDSDIEFDAMYVEHGSSAFDALLTVRDRQAFLFSGFKGRGQQQDHVVFVTSVRPVPLPERTGQVSAPEPEKARTYRLTIVDHSTSNRTVIANMEPGKAYTIPGFTVRVEEEEATGKRVGVVR